MTTAVGVVVGLVCTTAISADLTDGRPREVFAVVVPSIDPSPTTVAIADSDVYGMTQADVDKTMDAIAATNVKAVRLLIPWAGVEPKKGQLDWTSIDKTVNSAAVRNLAVVGVVNSTPAWSVAADGKTLSGRPASPAGYADFVAAVATRYHGKIAALEIWNEPNAVTIYSPKPDPAGYVDLLKACYAKIKAVDPAIRVLGGSLGAVTDYGTSAINPVTFLTQMYAAGAQNYFDALAYHPYQDKLKFSEGMGVANSPMQQLIELRKVMLANGDDGKRIWSTEYGQPTSQGGDAQQNTFISDMLTKWQELPYTGPMFVYTTRDRKTGSFVPNDTFGLFRTNWTPKPVQQTVQAGASGGISKSDEYQRFSSISDPALGEVLSPVYRPTPDSWAQIRTVSTIYETPTGVVTSPTPVAQKAGFSDTTPITPFVDGYQDFNKPNGLRVWYSPTTGAHSARKAIFNAWTPPLGLAISDEVGGPTGSRAEFEHGTITWTPGGAKATLTDGQERRRAAQRFHS